LVKQYGLYSATQSSRSPSLTSINNCCPLGRIRCIDKQDNQVMTGECSCGTFIRYGPEGGRILSVRYTKKGLGAEGIINAMIRREMEPDRVKGGCSHCDYNSDNISSIVMLTKQNLFASEAPGGDQKTLSGRGRSGSGRSTSANIEKP
jgi:hypothetical protein